MKRFFLLTKARAHTILFFLLVSAVNAHVYMNDWDLFDENRYERSPELRSVAYFDFKETGHWVDLCLNGHLHLFDHVKQNETELSHDDDMPNFLLASLESDSFANITQAADTIKAKFIILILPENSSWTERLRFWWTQTIPRLPTENLVSSESSTHYLLVVSWDAGNGKYRILVLHARSLL